MERNKKNIILRIQDWIESVAGQTFLNYAYSWGAAVVILGALFKLTHIPGANAMLFIGMGTEVLVFFISGFDRPAALKREEEELAGLAGEEDDDEGDEDMPAEERAAAETESGGRETVAGGGNVQPGGQPVMGGGTVIIGGGSGPALPADMQAAAVSGMAGGGKAVAPSGAASSAAVPQQPFDIKALSDMVAASNAELFAKVVEDARNASNPEMKEAAEAYVEELKVLTDTLARVSEQAEHMTRDSKEMDNLNRTLTGINTIYEMQLKSISTQVGAIDQINEQTRKMAHQIEELNAIYTRMIQALTVNMKHTPGGAAVE